MADTYDVAVVGATGVVGEAMLEILSPSGSFLIENYPCAGQFALRRQDGSTIGNRNIDVRRSGRVRFFGKTCQSDFFLQACVGLGRLTRRGRRKPVALSSTTRRDFRRRRRYPVGRARGESRKRSREYPKSGHHRQSELFDDPDGRRTEADL